MAVTNDKFYVSLSCKGLLHVTTVYSVGLCVLCAGLSGLRRFPVFVFGGLRLVVCRHSVPGGVEGGLID